MYCKYAKPCVFVKFEKQKRSGSKLNSTSDMTIHIYETPAVEPEHSRTKSNRVEHSQNQSNKVKQSRTATIFFCSTL